MLLFYASLLGVLQGLTEFFPISSSGHLVIAKSLVKGFPDLGIFFLTVLHAGTLLAILFFFRKEIFKLKTNDVLLLVAGTLPAAVLGYLFAPILEGFFANLEVVGFALVITGLLNLRVDRTKGKRKVDLFDAFFVGFFQAVAIIPGVSRSGATIFAGVKRGIDKKAAAKFSFLLSVPAVAGANLFEYFRAPAEMGDNFLIYALGFFFAFVSGVFAIGKVISLLEKGAFKYFGFYCLVLGFSVLLL